MNTGYILNPNDSLVYTGTVSKTEAINLMSQIAPEADPLAIQAFVDHMVSSSAHIINKNFIAPLAAQVTVGGRALALLRQEFPEYSDTELDQLCFDIVNNSVEAMRAATADQEPEEPQQTRKPKTRSK